MKLPKQNDKLQLLYELISDLNRIQDLDFLLEEVLRGARQTVNADAGSIYLVEGRLLHFRYSQNDTLEKMLPPGERLVYNIFALNVDNKSIAGYCALEGKAVNIPDAYKMKKDSSFSHNRKYDKISNYETHSILAFPLQTNTGAVIGVLQLINALDDRGSVRAFTADDEQVVSLFSSQATMALQRAQILRTMILRMTLMAEWRDPKETGPHVNRVAGYATELYRRWSVRHGVDPAESEKTSDIFRMAAMLHDVGKVGIDNEILRKPGKLTEEEFRIMKTHTTIGASLFEDSQSELDLMASTVAISHHERWDGAGYPNGLSGTDIPLWGRITAVADVFDALSSHRVYKDAWTQEDVLSEFRNQSGKQFDPEIVDLLFEALPNLKQIFERYPDA